MLMASVDQGGGLNPRVASVTCGDQVVLWRRSFVLMPNEKLRLRTLQSALVSRRDSERSSAVVANARVLASVRTDAHGQFIIQLALA